MEDKNTGILKFCGPTENSISNLENGVIFCQHFSAYNDPFEFWSNICEGVPSPESEPERFSAALKAWGMEGSSPYDEMVKEYLDECQDYQPSFKTMRNETRIACFGSQRDNMLMWSHYADGLRGFCISFDEKAIREVEPKAYILDVEYRATPPIVDSFIYAIAHDQNWFHQVAIEEAKVRIKYMEKSGEKHWIPLYENAAAEALEKMYEIWRHVFAVKPLDWEYEHERRLLVQTQQYDAKPILRPYPPEAIKEVILGERMHDDFRRRILTVLKNNYPSVPVRTARRAHGCYSIEIE